MTTNTEHRRCETDKLGEWIQQAALDEANKRIAELELELSNIKNSEPVVIIGGAWTLLWYSPESIKAIADHHGLKIGSKLYALPPAAANEGE